MTPRLWIFAVVCCIQLAVPASMVVNGERGLREGKVWVFRMAPMDPADLLRGRYVRLRFQATTGPAIGEGSFARGDAVYALLGEDENGFAEIVGVTYQRPDGNSYLETTVESSGDDGVWIDFPIERFYLPEEKAPAAESVVREAGADAWAEIRVREGQASIEDLLIEGIPILEAVEESMGEPAAGQTATETDRSEFQARQLSMTTEQELIRAGARSVDTSDFDPANTTGYDFTTDPPTVGYQAADGSVRTRTSDGRILSGRWSVSKDNLFCVSYGGGPVRCGKSYFHEGLFYAVDESGRVSGPTRLVPGDPEKLGLSQ